MAIKKTVDEVQIARSTAAGAYRKRAGYVRLGARGERGHLLVPDVHPLDLALPAKGIGQSVQTIADDSVNTLDACRGQRVCELICNGTHEWSPVPVHVSRPLSMIRLRLTR